jgi:hypothetical protein
MRIAIGIVAALAVVAVAVRIVLSELWLRRMARQWGLERTNYPLRRTLKAKLFSRHVGGRTNQPTPKKERTERGE